MKRKTFWVFAVLLLVASIGFGGSLIVKEHMKNTLRALNCMDAPPEKVLLVIEDESARQMYQPAHGERTVPVEIQFNLAPAAMDDVHIFMTSKKTNQMIYRGSYKQELKVQAGNALLESDGMDTFRFVFVNAKKGMICSGEQEVFGRAWRVDRPARIEFLPYRELDADIQTPVIWKIN